MKPDEYGEEVVGLSSVTDSVIDLLVDQSTADDIHRHRELSKNCHTHTMKTTTTTTKTATKTMTTNQQQQPETKLNNITDEKGC